MLRCASPAGPRCAGPEAATAAKAAAPPAAAAESERYCIRRNSGRFDHLRECRAGPGLRLGLALASTAVWPGPDSETGPPTPANAPPTTAKTSTARNPLNILIGTRTRSFNRLVGRFLAQLR